MAKGKITSYPLPTLVLHETGYKIFNDTYILMITKLVPTTLFSDTRVQTALLF